LRRTAKTSLLAFGILSLILFTASSAQAVYVISSFDFQITPTAQTACIGDNVLFNMAVIDATTTYANITNVVGAPTDTSIEISDMSFSSNQPSPVAPLYVYDGIHTWKITGGYTNVGLQSVTLTDANLIAGWPVGKYETLQFANFTAALGAMASFGTATVDIGTAVQGITMYDDGSAANADVLKTAPYNPGANDGVYNASFQVRENYGFTLSNASIAAHFTKGGVTASNEGFISPDHLSIDGKRPSVELVDANPNPFNPNKDTIKFYYYLTEDCNVQLRVFYNDVTVKTLSALGSGNTTQFISWDGLSETSALQTDGRYTYRFDVTDSAGNTGEPYVGNLIITTVSVGVNIQTIDTNYIYTGSETMVQVIVQVDTELDNATPANLANLGFDPAHYGATSYEVYPWTYTDLKLYNPDGSLLEVFPKDTSTAFDEDQFYINPVSNPAPYQDMTDAYWPYTYDPAGPDYCSKTPGVIYTDPDGNMTNDWNIVFGVPLINQGAGVYKKSEKFLYTNNLNTGNLYIVKANGILVGKSVVPVGNVLQIADRCVTTTVISDQLYHAQPSFFVDSSTGYITDNRGYGLSGDPRTAMFVVEPDPGVPIPDHTGPRVIPYSEYPSDSSTLLPGIVNTTNPVKVSLTDDGVGAGTTNLSSFVLKDPYGNQVPGQVAWNAGVPGTKTWDIYYKPNNPLTLGGKYVYVIIPKDAAGNAGTEYDYSFNIADTSIPTISNVNVQSQTGNTLQLSPSTSTQVTFLVSQLAATLVPGGTAAVDWKLSNIQVEDASNNVIAGTSINTPSTNIIVFTPQSVLADGSYKALITAVSANGFSGAATYLFNITTAGITYVDLSGTGENDTTYLRLSVFTQLSSGITDAGSNTVPSAALVVSAVPAPPVNAGHSFFATAVSFTAMGHVEPLNFNTTLCSAVLRLHYSDADLANFISATGLSESNLTLWVYDGSGWTQVNNISAPVNNPLTTDRYIEVPVTSIPNSNIYALMYVPPAGAVFTFNFPNTKVFDPGKGPAVILYSKELSGGGAFPASIGPLGGTGDVKVHIYSLAGSLVRTLEYQNSNDYPLFTGFSTNSGWDYFYFTWDGRNDHGRTVRNGMYIMKIEKTTAAGIKTTTSRTIALIK
jgi:hypothetical protein